MSRDFGWGRDEGYGAAVVLSVVGIAHGAAQSVGTMATVICTMWQRDQGQNGRKVGQNGRKAGHRAVVGRHDKGRLTDEVSPVRIVIMRVHRIDESTFVFFVGFVFGVCSLLVRLLCEGMLGGQVGENKKHTLRLMNQLWDIDPTHHRQSAVRTVTSTQLPAPPLHGGQQSHAGKTCQTPCRASVGLEEQA